MRQSTQAIAPAMRRETRGAVKIARSMIEDAETAARAEMKAKDYTLCRHCIAGLTNFLIANPDATHEATQAETESLWDTCGACKEEYHAHLSRQAEAARYCDLDGHAHNGDDIRWQNGGAK